MKNFLTDFFLLFLITVFYAVSATPATHSARNLFSFKSMISYTTNRSAWDYHNYGGWCGLGGAGEPVDGVDRCCQIHDFCYDDLNIKECKGMMKLRTYYVIYNWKWIDDQIVCVENANDCSKQLCKCDKAAAECFGRHEYLEKHRNSVWDQSWWSLPSMPQWLTNTTWWGWGISADEGGSSGTGNSSWWGISWWNG